LHVFAAKKVNENSGSRFSRFLLERKEKTWTIIYQKYVPFQQLSELIDDCYEIP